MLKRNTLQPVKHNPSSKNHTQAHETVTGNEFWYSDEPPDLGQGFAAAAADKRHTTVTEILLRAAKKAEKTGNTEMAQAYYQLLDKLEECRPRHRCGSLACPRCARAYQKAKVLAHEDVITLWKKGPDKQLVFVTLIPKKMMYQPGHFSEIEVKKANRWLKDVLREIGKRTMLGSADLSWETRRGQGYIQLHWHLLMWTKSRKGLKKKLAFVFPRTKKHERPVKVRVADDLGFLAYMNKAIKLAELLRAQRTHLPELLLMLDRTDPIDLMVHTKVRLIAQSSQLAFKPIG
jgi:hypothetical protein